MLSEDHFSVDGTLIEAWASHKSFRPKDEKPEDRPPPDDPGNPSVNFRGEKRSNATHASTTDPDARLARKSSQTGAILAYSQHALMENRNGLLIDMRIAHATGTAEREMALRMIDENPSGTRRITLGADRGYDTSDFVAQCRARNVTPHVAQNISGRRRSAVDRRTTREPGYSASLRIRKRIEEVFGWTKTIGGFRKTRYRGLARVQLASYFTAAAYNLVRMGNLIPITT